MTRREFFHTIAGLSVFTAGCLLRILDATRISKFFKAEPYLKYPGIIKPLCNITEGTEWRG